jgi:RsiW-degrading membrane proteinase PrsW (M82 family)
LFVNRKSEGTRIPDTGIALWENITLKKGNNSIKARGLEGGHTYSDYCVFVLDTGFGTRTIAKIFDVLQYISLMLIINLLVLLILWYYAWKKKPKPARWKRITLKVFFFTFMLTALMLIVIKAFIGSRLG